MERITATSLDSATLACPKHMVHGPCGGVQADGSCEIGGPCSFVVRAPGGEFVLAVPSVAGASGVAAAAVAPGAVLGPAGLHVGGAASRVLTPAAAALLALMDRRPIVVVDLPSAGPDPEAEAALAAAVAGRVDAALLGDAPWARVQLPPAIRGGIVAREGVVPWNGLNCRDRNRAALQSELAGLAAGGIPAVHCVTGDHPALGHRADAEPVFDLDSTQLATLAGSTTGLLISAAESPAAPPTADRPARAAAKARAGAQVCFINHAGSRDELAEFAAAVHALAPELRLIACVPLVASTAGAERLAAFLHGPVPEALMAPLRQRDPVRAAVAAAVDQATRVLALPGIGGVDLSAPAGPGESLAVAAALALAGAELGGGS